MGDANHRWWGWALTGTAVVATGVAGYYFYRSIITKSGDDTTLSTVGEEEVGSRLKLAKALQMRTIQAVPTSQLKPKTPSKASVGPANGAAGGKSKLCAECRKPLSGLPQRCSNCKVTYYCSKDCQKRAWPKHKDSCKSISAKPATPEGKEEAPASAVSRPVQNGQTAGPQSVQEALAHVLEESAAGKSDKLESMFETSVMLFLRADYRGAITQLHQVQELARSRGVPGVEAEVYKWLGHCWSKLMDVKRAEQYFTEGAEFALAKGLTKLQADCLGGLGMLYRSQNEPNKAMLLLNKALELADQLGDLDLKASMLCNMGSVLMQVDQEQALIALQSAVALREQTIEKLHDSGERAGLATAVMEHATAMVNLASALYVCKKLEDAKSCYERALEVFELVEDSDKVVKVLVNLANMCELQMKDKAGSRESAAQYRDRLITFLQSSGQRVPEDTCAVCLESLGMSKPSVEGKELIMLACMHCLHDECWNKHLTQVADEKKDVVCPTCRQPVIVYE
ncbi:hypothetical protein CEUSTIGMA_g1290.t1 [Chlamydomonas eustigma]|uniref:MYND-type domain-containing protein n=1 Tax=Chlamydomonas eustigma TaxID=1157962 RepID=A0A250WTI1_9CHLO|nr:hypothetical protein CEUSTIGMA_g1290.t1 [Chlamydomonas eustigma]|eukprot:GAX73840.1 hypothetical protein CEUSTIGMA_g1290.t1 [Chlamydomonas eustigma]